MTSPRHGRGTQPVRLARAIVSAWCCWSERTSRNSSPRMTFWSRIPVIRLCSSDHGGIAIGEQSRGSLVKWLRQVLIPRCRRAHVVAGVGISRQHLAQTEGRHWRLSSHSFFWAGERLSEKSIWSPADKTTQITALYHPRPRTLAASSPRPTQPHDEKMVQEGRSSGRDSYRDPATCRRQPRRTVG